MKISTKSWHYRLLNTMDMSIPRSLCPYFWKVVFTIGFIGVITTFLAIIFHGVGAKALWNWFDYDANFVYATLFGFTLVVSVLAAVIGVFFGFFYASEKELFTIKTENIVINYIRAKKSKICPTLEFDYE
ncbi:hypothetical protein PHG31p209 [Aeromonas phage 31]|uniref:Uncharacterized protein n=3 Tax=Biquartavirus 44RR2 TaxID=115987 RepID=Q6U990_9CAUD|nr:membrane protein [Aeromonas phage 44RR2.8t]YP_238938.1 membrane protein [Aeromonas phage 31]APU00684.1 hypothetical protein [Aeromonas phage 44RR2.8t.2]APU01103.1 hypothetical protein [Aeromonas phage 31.2]APU02013.1 hypothetical protein [Aeromonas phage L9-6]APU02264.1 hypothetical protein [Aeromonas phage Riv-10]APU02512.1 hypothetical protein [Aeromonas phage SW69-9]